MAEAKKGDNKKIITTKDVKQEKAAQSAKNRAAGGKDVEVSVLDTVNVRFTDDFGKHIKKGHEQRMSVLAFEVYDKNGVVEKIN